MLHCVTVCLQWTGIVTIWASSRLRIPAFRVSAYSPHELLNCQNPLQICLATEFLPFRCFAGENVLMSWDVLFVSVNYFSYVLLYMTKKVMGLIHPQYIGLFWLPFERLFICRANCQDPLLTHLKISFQKVGPPWWNFSTSLVCCSVLQLLQCVAVCCSVLQCVAVCCNVTSV